MRNALAVQRGYAVVAAVAFLLGFVLFLFPQTIATLPSPDRSANP